MAYLRGWITPELYKQGNRSLFREHLILQSLAAETEADDARLMTQAQMAFAPIVATSSAGPNAFLQSLQKQIRVSREIRELNPVPNASDMGSVDAMFRLYQALEKTGYFQVAHKPA